MQMKLTTFRHPGLKDRNRVIYRKGELAILGRSGAVCAMLDKFPEQRPENRYSGILKALANGLRRAWQWD